MTYDRFEDLPVWQAAIKLCHAVFDLVDDRAFTPLGDLRNQLQRAALSISNNIAEGSGSDSPIEFSHFLNIAHLSAFETAHIVLFLHSKSMLANPGQDRLLTQFEEVCRMITGFRRSL